VLWRWSGERAVVLPPDADTPIVLEDVAALIWYLLAEPQAEDELIGQLAAASGAGPSTVAAATRPFLEQMRRNAALQCSPGDPS
jgi:hypothetical protein